MSNTNIKDHITTLAQIATVTLDYIFTTYIFIDFIGRIKVDIVWI